MELNIINKKDEPLLSRTKIESEILFEKATPSTSEVKSNLAKALGKDEKLLDVKHILTIFGLKKANVLCYAYENEEILKKIVLEKKKKSGKKEQGEKQEPKKEEKAEAKKEEKPEPKQESKKENQSKEQKQPEKEKK